MGGLTYKDAGVDIEAGERLVDRIRPMAKSTRTPLVLGGVGGFAGLCALPPGLKEPVLVAGTDGVGTKLKLAFMMDRHASVGIDLVAMCVNDVITVGAQPLFFLDYLATSKIELEQASAIVEGIAEGCRQSGCALLGGETAELPGFYAPSEYDLAGFAVGIVDRAAIRGSHAVELGDVLIGLPSNGLHSNGFSLARRALLDVGGLSLDATPNGSDEPLGDTLLRPTLIYAKAAAAALSTGSVHAMCHVTGGGVPGNLPRVLPEGLGAVLDSAWDEPLVFQWIREHGNVEEAEMRRTFNLGVGFVLAVAPDDAETVMAALRTAGSSPFRMGRVTESAAEGEARVQYGS